MSSFRINFNNKAKLILLLLLIVTLLAAKSFFIEKRAKVKSTQKMKKSGNQKRLKRAKVNKNSSNRERVDLKKIYGKEFSRKNPFSQQQVNRAEFSYQLSSDSLDDLSPLKGSLELKGIVNHSLVIINHCGQTLLSKVGAEIGGYKIVEIQEDKVIYLKEGRRYFSNLTVASSLNIGLN